MKRFNWRLVFTFYAYYALGVIVMFLEESNHTTLGAIVGLGTGMVMMLQSREEIK